MHHRAMERKTMEGMNHIVEVEDGERLLENGRIFQQRPLSLPLDQDAVYDENQDIASGQFCRHVVVYMYLVQIACYLST